MFKQGTADWVAVKTKRKREAVPHIKYFSQLSDHEPKRSTEEHSRKLSAFCRLTMRLTMVYTISMSCKVSLKVVNATGL